MTVLTKIPPSSTAASRNPNKEKTGNFSSSYVNIKELERDIRRFGKDENNEVTVDKDGVYGQVVRVITKDNKGRTLAQIKSDELDIEFTIPFDDSPTPNEAEIILYNLSEASIARLTPKQNQMRRIVIEAGYRDDIGVVFDGVIRKVTTSYTSVDRVTKIIAMDSGNININLFEQEVRLTYEEGTNSETVLRDLIKKSGLPVATFQISSVRKFDKSVTVEGDIHQMIAKYAERS